MEKYKIGFTSVVGDLLHPGHILMLKDCKDRCDYLICGLICDPTKDRPKKNKPIESVYDRFTRLAAVKYVDEVVPLEDERDLEEFITREAIDVRFVGADYIEDMNHTGRALCAKLNIPIEYLNRNHGNSSTNLRERIYEAEKLKRKENKNK